MDGRMQLYVVLLMTLVVFHGALCSNDCCGSTQLYFRTQFDREVNLSLNGLINVVMYVYEPGFTCIADIEDASLKILRNDGELEMHSLTNNRSINHTGYGVVFDSAGNISDSGFSYAVVCQYRYYLYQYYCYFNVELRPMDLRYDGSEISLLVYLPECYTTPNISGVTTLHIQGLLDAPTDVSVDIMDEQSVNVSWSPPLTLDGVPILQYSVNITSQGLTVQRNTNDTYITLERPCTTTTYQITAWSLAGQGLAAIYDLTIHQAIVKSASLLPEPGICLSCTFLAGSTGDGCAVRLQNDQHTFIFNTSRHDNEALECFLVPDTGVYSVHVYDVQYGEVQEHTSRLLDQVIIEKRDEFSLKHAVIEMVDELGGICAACYFKSGSNAGGCAIKIQNDETGTFFNISHVDEIDFECFSVPKAGVFSVYVYEIQSNGTLGHEVIRLPDITVRLPNATTASEDSVQQRGVSPVVLGLGAVLGLVVAVVIVAVMVAAVRRTRMSQNLKPLPVPANDTAANSEPNKTTSSVADMQPTESATSPEDDHLYDIVGMMKTSTEQEAAEKCEGIELSSNAAYGRVQTGD